MSLGYDPATILGFALEWFDKHEPERPRCTCSTNPTATETLSTSVHKPECAVSDFVKKGWAWSVDHYMEMSREGR